MTCSTMTRKNIRKNTFLLIMIKEIRESQVEKRVKSQVTQAVSKRAFQWKMKARKKIIMRLNQIEVNR